MSCIEMDVLPCDWTYDAPKISLVLVWIVTFPLKNEATSHIEFVLPYLCRIRMKLRKIIHGVWYHYHEILISRKYQKLSQSYYTGFR